MCFGTTLMMRTHSRLESSLSGVGGLLAGGCRTIVEQCADDLLRLDDDALNDSRRLGSGGGGDSRFKGINMASSALTLYYVMLSTHTTLLGRATRSVVHTLIVMHVLPCHRDHMGITALLPRCPHSHWHNSAATPYKRPLGWNHRPEANLHTRLETLGRFLWHICHPRCPGGAVSSPIRKVVCCRSWKTYST